MVLNERDRILKIDNMTLRGGAANRAMGTRPEKRMPIAAQVFPMIIKI